MCLANKSPGILKMFLDNGFNFIIDTEDHKIFGLNEDCIYDALLLENIKTNHQEICEEKIPIASILYRKLSNPLYYTSSFRPLIHKPNPTKCMVYESSSL
ncbi:MAG: hypothetical protein BGO67_02655 [Alphaproteobacteria bacterium 41-28]|nr:MAG: hypothetical protein BGO67_02655 [Alphaproteobacteria bacterium 41-28]